MSKRQKPRQKKKTQRQQVQEEDDKKLKDIAEKIAFCHNPYFYFYLERSRLMQKNYPLISKTAMQYFITLDWTALSANEKLRYETLHMIETQSYLNLEKEKILKQYSIDPEEESQSQQNITVKVQSDFDEKGKFQEEMELIKSAAKIKFEPIGEQMKVFNAAQVEVQINYCASSKSFFQNTVEIRNILKEHFPNAKVVSYPVGGNSKEIGIYAVDGNQETQLIWHNHQDGLISIHNKDKFATRLNTFINEYY